MSKSKNGGWNVVGGGADKPVRRSNRTKFERPKELPPSLGEFTPLDRLIFQVLRDAPKSKWYSLTPEEILSRLRQLRDADDLNLQVVWDSLDSERMRPFVEYSPSRLHAYRLRLVEKKNKE
jgi:hypothetical protein